MILLNTEKLSWIKHCFFIAMFSFPIMPIKFINLFFIGFAILTVYLFFREKPKWIFSEFVFFGLFTLPFIPYLIEFILYPTNTVIQFELEKKTLFFLAPVVFYINSLLQKKIEIRYAINCFVCSVFISSIASFSYLLFSGNLLSISSYQNGAFELRRLFEELSGQHPIYYGLFSTTACLWVVFNFDIYSRKLQWLLGFSVFFMILINLLIAAKMPLLILFFVGLWIATKKIPNKKKLLLIYLSSFILIIGVSFLIPSLKNRLLEIPNYFYNQNPNNTLIERSVIFKCSKAIFVQDFLMGVGARNTQGLIDYCYIWIKFYKGLNAHFNSHNQFLTLGINYGIGIILLFFTLIVSLYVKFKNNPLAIIFLFCSVAIMLTESILERQMGIYYFLFFGLLFLLPFSSAYNKNASKENAK